VDDQDRENQQTDYLEYLDPDQRADYEHSSAEGEGLVGKAPGHTGPEGTPLWASIGNVIRHGEEDGPTDAGTAETGGARPPSYEREPGPATTDYTTSNYSEDVGRAPTESDVEVVNEEYS
jgi:hypothetical protein